MLRANGFAGRVGQLQSPVISSPTIFSALSNVQRRRISLDGTVNTNSPDYVANAEHMNGLLQKFRDISATVRAGGGERSVALLRKRGKMLPRERIEAVLDPGSPLLEIAPLAGYELYGKEVVPSAGVVTGIGSIHGRKCMVVANDPTVKGGTMYPITASRFATAYCFEHFPLTYARTTGEEAATRTVDRRRK